MQMRGLEGRVALVTGAGGGIGTAICSRFVEEGINVIAADIDEGSLRALSQSMGSGGRGAYPVRLDITDFTAVQQAVEEAVSRFGCVDILVNNAGWDAAKPFLETAPDFWDKVIAINLKGPLNLHHAVLPHMIRTGQGKIINIASDAGRVGSSGEAVYSACKGGLISFTKTIARECAARNTVVNAFAPGRPIRRCCSPSREKANTASRFSTVFRKPYRSNASASPRICQASLHSWPVMTPIS
jgi:2-hydroxycyclohexanecarboxyl-CoA dehydrogenase